MKISTRRITLLVAVGLLVILSSVSVPLSATNNNAADNTSSDIAASGADDSVIVTPTATDATINISVTDSTNGQDNATVDISVATDDTSGELPTEIEGQVTTEQYNAVLDGDSELTAPKLSKAVNGWASSSSVNGVSIGAPELSALINYWANN